MKKITIQRAEVKDRTYISEKLIKYGLDTYNADWRQFFVARADGKTVAFGRIIEHEDCLEIASLGVDYYYRGKGIGEVMLTYLVGETRKLDSRKAVYGVTHLPGFMAKAGFKEISGAPEAMEYKKNHRCNDPSKMSIMKWD